jgi:hypothetical protein
MAQYLQNRQSRIREEWRFRVEEIREFYWPREKVLDRIQLLEQSGVIEKAGENQYRLTAWDYHRAPATER